MKSVLFGLGRSLGAFPDGMRARVAGPRAMRSKRKGKGGGREKSEGDTDRNAASDRGPPVRLDEAGGAGGARDAADGDFVGYAQPEPMDSELHRRFYRAQAICESEDDLQQLLRALKSPLPVSFRVSGLGRFAHSLNSHISHRLLRDLHSNTERLPDGRVALHGEPIEPPTQLSWYPGGLAWQLNYSRNQLRKLPPLKALHEFLKTANDFGSISRQEAVSMIPPLLLDINSSDQSVLDLCAAPGSKTFQILELLHSNQSDNAQPPGLVVANDSQVKRCHMLVHQVKRACSASLLVTNHDAQMFPSIRPVQRARHFLFDRVLVDVPCSGDGTIRKSPDILPRWNTGSAISLHSMQLKILMRGLQQLKPGGRLVYSTCSLNPIENEAVVAEALRMGRGTVYLEDVSSELPGLKRRKGLSSWRVMDEGGHWRDIDSADDVNSTLYRSMFAPNDDEKLRLDRCLRVLPHDNDTGGFFVAVLIKNEPLPADVEVGAINMRKSKKRANQENSEGLLAVDRTKHCTDAHEGKSQTEVKKRSLDGNFEADDDDTRQGIETNEATKNKDEGTSSDGADAATEEHEHQAQTSHRPRFIEKLERLGLCLDDERGPHHQELAQFTLETRQRSTRDTQRDHSTNQQGVEPVIPVNDEAIHNEIADFYGLHRSVNLKDCLVTRNWSEAAEKPKRLYLISEGIQLILRWDQIEKLRVISAGTKFCEKQDNRDPNAQCDYRLTQEAVNQFGDQLSKQQARITKNEMRKLMHFRRLSLEISGEPHAVESEETVKSIQACKTGCIVMTPDLGDEEVLGIVSDRELSFAAWRGQASVALLIQKSVSKHLLQRLGGADDLPPLENGNGQEQGEKRKREEEGNCAALDPETDDAVKTEKEEERHEAE